MADLSILASTESARVSEFVFGAYLGSDLSAGVLERFRLSESTTVLENVSLFESGFDELGHLGETVTVVRGLTASPSEAMRLSEVLFGKALGSDLSVGLQEGPVKASDISAGIAAGSYNNLPAGDVTTQLRLWMNTYCGGRTNINVAMRDVLQQQIPSGTTDLRTILNQFIERQ